MSTRGGARRRDTGNSAPGSSWTRPFAPMHHSEEQEAEEERKKCAESASLRARCWAGKSGLVRTETDQLPNGSMMMSLYRGACVMKMCAW